jgi:hypothetical protein
MSETKLQPQKTTGEIVILYILIFMFADNRREDKSFWTSLQEH